MSLYRKKIEERTEIYIRIDTDVIGRSSSFAPHGFIIKHTAPIPFLATSTIKPIESLTVLPLYKIDNFTNVILCEDGWVESTEDEYNNEFIGAIEQFPIFKQTFKIIKTE